MRRRLRLLVPLLLSGTLVAAFGAASPPAVANPGDPPGEIRLPALFGTRVPTVSFFAATPSGVAWLLDEGDDRIGSAFYTSYSGVQHTDSDLGDTADLSLSGNELTGGQPGHLGSPDIDTGSRRGASCSPTYYVGGNEGCLAADVVTTGPNAGPGVRLSIGSQIVRYALPNPGGTQFQILVESLDAGGAIVSTLSLGGATDPASLA
jgi:hypothetical protein